MPELPEVETLRKDLSRYLIDARVKKVVIGLPKFVSPKKGFAKKIVSRRIVSIKRYGKLLVFVFDNKSALHVHLKMTGQVVLRHKKLIIFGGHAVPGLTALPNKYTHLTLRFAGGDELYVNDVRQFGYARLYTEDASKKLTEKIGIEPLSRSFTFQVFERMTQRRSGTVKSFLLNQTFVAGLGNIYVDESCFRAGVRPGRKLPTFSNLERRRLYQAIRSVLIQAVKHRGTTRSTYQKTDAKDSSFVPYLNVYGRGGKPCRRCGKSLTRSRENGRGTVYCSFCQA
ncbi:MAG: bifunctional DNA-formamidopyrimidine glycosylase/DNA-(apurinic or apyrimidinic site) lyase [Patescibacteria group bacterium]|jgi:formamidopyrimidine-DNA glycosylase